MGREEDRPVLVHHLPVVRAEALRDVSHSGGPGHPVPAHGVEDLAVGG
jgi:hypothetical protein